MSAIVDLTKPKAIRTYLVHGTADQRAITLASLRPRLVRFDMLGWPHVVVYAQRKIAANALDYIEFVPHREAHPNCPKNSCAFQKHCCYPDVGYCEVAGDGEEP